MSQLFVKVTVSCPPAEAKPKSTLNRSRQTPFKKGSGGGDRNSAELCKISRAVHARTSVKKTTRQFMAFLLDTSSSTSNRLLIVASDDHSLSALILGLLDASRQVEKLLAIKLAMVLYIIILTVQLGRNQGVITSRKYRRNSVVTETCHVLMMLPLFVLR